MALRLKKDVHKASYYVWFLGAQEAKELRGDKVLLSTIPRLIARQDQEPLKVTLQVSHKGLKIIQGSAKHFIPHNAITSSIVKDDIVSCILLLYNPETKCPLHVHAYRLDSELTAHALNDQLQTLIKKPENQKRFAELELKLETSLRSIERSKPLSMPSRNNSKHFDVSQRRFDSSLGSDTGTSTECSEEQQHSPVERPAHLYDSLAAELRAKLNGNGPPLLLPPRDYDTISRSQGNLTAVSLRRCQNLSIVGKDVKGVKKRGHVSSHGSSGIGSDLAPSPERHEEISNSSSDDWKNDMNDGPSTGFVRKMEKIHLSDEKMSPTRYRENPPSYIFPKEPLNDYKYKEKPYRIEEDQPIVVKKQMNHEVNKKHYIEPVKPLKDERKHHGGLMRQQSERYRQATDRIEYTRNDRGKYEHERHFEREHYERENLTDRQKYREIVENKKYRSEAPMRVEMHRLNDYKKDERDYPAEDHVRTIQRKSKTERYESHEPSRTDRMQKVSDDFVERNPYREPDSLPYRQSIENMMKSPVMKYKSKTAYDRRSPSPNNEMYLHAQRNGRSYSNNAAPTRRMDQDRSHYVKDSSPMSTMKKTSPKDRFEDAKEKFQAMEKIRIKESKPLGVRRSEPMRYEKDYRQSYSPEPSRSYQPQNDWSSEEEFQPNVRDYREVQQQPRHNDRDIRGMGPAKSLGNLVNVKGYRHSYAEPLKYCNRVGLAAIEPY